MAKVGDLVVRVRGDTKQFDSSIKKSQTITQKFTKFLIAGAGITGAILVFRRLAGAVGSLVKAYGIQELAEAKLRSALKATGNAVGITFDAMKEFAKELQNVTTFGDEAIIGAQGLLTTFTQIGKEVFPVALEAAADMSTMFGQDLQQSVIQLGTALNDPIAGVGRLKRIGISFTEEQRNTIKGFVEANDIMSAQKVILDELRVEFGGVAKEMATTGTGALKQYSNAMGDLKELLGGIILERFLPLIQGTTEFVKWLTEALSGLAREQKRSAQWQEILNAEMLIYKDNVEEAIDAIEELTQAQIDAREKEIEITLRK